MKAIDRTIDLAAPVDAVWKVLTDIESYSDWNPFLSIDRTPAAIGDRLLVTVRPGRRTMTFRPTVTAFRPEREMSWVGRFLVRGLADGTHTFALSPLPNGDTRFSQREVFRGLLVPFLGAVLRDTDAGFAAMNTALAARLQALACRTAR